MGSKNNSNFAGSGLTRWLSARWLEVAKLYADEWALLELDSGRRWTFAELARAGEETSGKEGSIVFPRGNTADFILAVLRAWQNDQAVCPLEVNQAEPTLTDWDRNWVHFKLTSASTGPARLVAFTAEQLAADARQIVDTMGLRRDWPNWGVISLAHSYGFSNLVTPLLLHGIPLVLGGSTLPEMVRRATSLFPALTLPAVPALWRTWLEAEAIGPQIRLAISAGAPLPLAIEEQAFARLGLKIHNFYGASECGGIAYDRSKHPRTDASYAGEAMVGVGLTVNSDGCLEVRSPAVGASYWPDPDASLSGGCFRTSDLVEVKQEGVFLRGRQSDLMNVAGRKISPEPIEQALRSHPGVGECVVFGVPDADASRGDRIVACVSVRSNVDAGVLRDFLLERLSAWEVPREWWLVEGLQPNQRGKISRSEWRRRFLHTGLGQHPRR